MSSAEVILNQSYHSRAILSSNWVEGMQFRARGRIFISYARRISHGTYTGQLRLRSYAGRLVVLVPSRQACSRWPHRHTPRPLLTGDGTTVNDVVYAAFAGALRRYTLHRKEEGVDSRKVIIESAVQKVQSTVPSLLGWQGAFKQNLECRPLAQGQLQLF